VIEIIRKDIALKVISVFSAILLWLVVLNRDNPYDSKTVFVPIREINKETLEEKKLYLKNYDDLPRSVEINYRGRREVAVNVLPADFSVVLDYSKIKSAEDKTIRLNEPYLVNPKDIAIIGYNPHFVRIELENIVEREFPIDVVLQGEPEAGYRVVGVSQNPKSVVFKERESLINTVSSVKANLDIKGLNKNLETKLECKAYNKKGEEIAQLSKNVFADIKIEMGKVVPVIPDVRGKPHQDYVDTGISVSPAQAVITGNPDVIAGIKELTTEPIDIENIRESLNTKGLVKLPDGVRLAGMQNEFAVSVGIEQLQKKEYIIPRESISIKNTVDDGSLHYEVKTENVTVVLKGRQGDLDSISLNSLKPSIDVRGLDEGAHSVALNIVLPPSIKLDNEKSIEVKISKIKTQ